MQKGQYRGGVSSTLPLGQKAPGSTTRQLKGLEGGEIGKNDLSVKKLRRKRNFLML